MTLSRDFLVNLNSTSLGNLNFNIKLIDPLNYIEFKVSFKLIDKFIVFRSHLFENRCSSLNKALRGCIVVISHGLSNSQLD